MNIPFACILAALVLIFVPRTVSLVLTYREKGMKGYDNRTPRIQQATLTGLPARAQGAHLNSIEAFGPFAAAVICATLAQVDPFWLNSLSIGFIVIRIIYIACYIGDVDKIRSPVWFLGMSATGTLLLLAAFGLAKALP